MDLRLVCAWCKIGEGFEQRRRQKKTFLIEAPSTDGHNKGEKQTIAPNRGWVYMRRVFRRAKRRLLPAAHKGLPRGGEMFHRKNND